MIGPDHMCRDGRAIAGCLTGCARTGTAVNRAANFPNLTRVKAPAISHKTPGRSLIWSVEFRVDAVLSRLKAELRANSGQHQSPAFLDSLLTAIRIPARCKHESQTVTPGYFFVRLH